MNLSNAQSMAINHIDGPCLVLAGPGSGKTFTLTYRIKQLIDNGISANKILVITFTKAAAMEMKERFNKMSDEIYPVTFGTFHSLFWGILQKETGLKSDSIIMGDRRESIIREAIRLCHLDVEDADYCKAISNEISKINNLQIDLEEYESPVVSKLDVINSYKMFSKLKDKYRVIDFDDMLSKAYELFIDRPEILKKWQDRFEYFLVDEVQDMNDLQYKLICMLSKCSNNIFVVGDDDQSIYDFRGANPEIMLNFEKDFAGTKRILLDTNYRCPRNIVEVASNLISNNSLRFEKEIKASQDTGEIAILSCKDNLDESKKIIDTIKAISREECLDEIAVLYRNHSCAGFLVNEMINAGVPFYLKDNLPNIYTHFIINDFETYFQIAVGNSTRQRILSIMNRPNRFLLRQSIENGYSFSDMESFYAGNQGMLRNVEAFRRDINLISKMTPLAAFNYIKNIVGYIDFLKELSIKNHVDLSEYLDVCDLFAESIKDCKTLNAAIEKIGMLRLKIDYENKSKSTDRSGKVGFYTLHSSKGLEFNNVFIIGVNEKVIPAKTATEACQIESERRLFYVGITRAKKRLYLSYVNEKNRDRMCPSRFINELNLEDYSSPKASS